MTRRSFLRLVAGVGAMGLAASLSVGFWPVQVPPPGFALKYFSPYELAVVDKAAARIAPADHELPAAAMLDVARKADRLIADRLDPTMQAEFHQLLGLFGEVPLLGGRLTPFLSQDPRSADGYLAAWAGSPLALLRQGFSGLRRLCAAIYYADSRSWPAIRYDGPWIGRLDVGYGLDNQGDGPPVNPNVYAKFPA